MSSVLEANFVSPGPSFYPFAAVRLLFLKMLFGMLAIDLDFRVLLLLRGGPWFSIF
jgi:hypothetical protein